jgi:hypothetical protein
MFEGATIQAIMVVLTEIETRQPSPEVLESQWGYLPSCPLLPLKSWVPKKEELEQ